MKSSLILLAAALGVVTASSAGCVQVNTYVGPSEGVWFDANNWDLSRIPDMYDEVEVTGKTVVVDNPAALKETVVQDLVIDAGGLVVIEAGNRFDIQRADGCRPTTTPAPTTSAPPVVTTTGGAVATTTGGAVATTTGGAVATTTGGAVATTTGGAVATTTGGAVATTTGGAVATTTGGAVATTTGGAVATTTGGAVATTTGGAVATTTGGAVATTTGGAVATTTGGAVATTTGGAVATTTGGAVATTTGGAAATTTGGAVATTTSQGAQSSTTAGPSGTPVTTVTNPPSPSNPETCEITIKYSRKPLLNLVARQYTHHIVNELRKLGLPIAIISDSDTPTSGTGADALYSTKLRLSQGEGDASVEETFKKLDADFDTIQPLLSDFITKLELDAETTCLPPTIDAAFEVRLGVATTLGLLAVAAM